MKALVALITILAILGSVYALALVGVIPVKPIALSSPAAAKLLIALKLYHPVAKKAAIVAALPLTSPDPLAADRASLQAERQQLVIEKAALDKKMAGGGSGVTTSSKMSAIYDTMKPAQIASIFAKLPDAQVCDAIVKMDEMEAGKVLAAIPPDRAAKITILLNQTTASNPQTGQQAQSLPATSVP
jgi:hypothetical protein